jgi:hypothetical protein
MSNLSHRAEHYRDMADECRQLATFSVSSKLKSHFSQMAYRYGKLAEAEEQCVPYHDRRDDFACEVQRSVAVSAQLFLKSQLAPLT